MNNSNNMLNSIVVWMNWTSISCFQWTMYPLMDKFHLILLPVIKPVDLHAIKWLTQIYIFVFIKTLRDIWVVQ